MKARLGDTIVCDVRMPRPDTIALRLNTPESVAYANKLLAARTGWRLHGLMRSPDNAQAEVSHD